MIGPSGSASWGKGGVRDDQHTVHRQNAERYKIVRAAVGISLVKFCETGSNIVPPTSQKIAAIKKMYVLVIILEYYF